MPGDRSRKGGLPWGSADVEMNKSKQNSAIDLFSITIFSVVLLPSIL